MLPKEQLSTGFEQHQSLGPDWHHGTSARAASSKDLLTTPGTTPPYGEVGQPDVFDVGLMQQRMAMPSGFGVAATHPCPMLQTHQSSNSLGALAAVKKGTWVSPS